MRINSTSLHFSRLNGIDKCYCVYCWPALSTSLKPLTAYASGITLLRGKVWLLVVGPLLGRLAKGERVPITLHLQPLVDTPTFARSQSGQQDLQDKQVHMTAPVQTSCCNHGVTQKPAQALFALQR